ncbi:MULTISPECIES: AMP nucleosidase [Rhizobium]|uniref:AMP nucleosidase n=1 Tax=Rhizobium favelukesii TaxID=348824 RepID=W6R6U5_9HYPH|nr:MULTISPECIES: AMP nucleosidase [Rhizobium]MCA0801116.1 AMP nucleosidase [Rhizobium sp. T1473]MCS0458522.1 AMP nucleosidase [Rhizobium favelukesii]UFS81332.1 AMP nucleosidase [Rhizobium sp. T136]CDM56972.1 AMP nucleosidase [Rhizobium favelukesii]
MSKRISSPLDISSPSPFVPQTFDDPVKAVDVLTELYERNTTFLIESFARLAKGAPITSRYRAFYPQVSIETTSYGHIDTRLSYGHVTAPGVYTTTITRPQLFRHYLKQQLGLLMKNHDVPVVVSESTTPIPLHFAFGEGAHVEASAAAFLDIPMRDLFDTPDLNTTDDEIANGEYIPPPGEPSPLAAFTAQRIDYSFARLAHYTATGAQHFQNFVLFTNYQFYIDEFCLWARKLMAEGGDGYTAFVEPGNIITHAGSSHPETDVTLARLPQMPAYHLKKKGHAGITMINIGVGPSNAKTITDHVAVLRPHAWLMLGHCAGLRNSQRLGDYVLAHAYMREDHVLDDDLPVWVPIPALAEVQVALEGAVAEVTGYEGFELKRIMRTGTVGTIDNRNWELRDQRGPVRRLSQARAIALDMESATIAANGFRFRVPYGTLLCVSDKPLHGELKLPGMATAFYRTQVNQHLQIGIRAIQKLAAMPPETLHSRKLRSFFETAFQ